MKTIHYRPNSPVWVKAIITAAASLVLFFFNVSLIALILASTSYQGKHEASLGSDGLIRDFVTGSILNPLVETLIMWPMLIFIHFYTQRNWLTCLIVALIWGAFHGAREPIWALTGFTGFFVFSYFFLLGKRNSTKEGFWLAFSIHALNNTYGVLLYYLVS